MKVTFCEAPKVALDLAAHIAGAWSLGTIPSLGASVRVFIETPHVGPVRWDTTSDAITGAVSVTITATQSDLFRSGGLYRLFIFNLTTGELEPLTANGVTAESVTFGFFNECPVPEAPHTLTLYNETTCPPEDCGC